MNDNSGVRTSGVPTHVRIVLVLVDAEGPGDYAGAAFTTPSSAELVSRQESLADRSFTLIEVVDDHMSVETVSRRGEIVDSAIVPRREIMAQPVEATE